VSLYILCRDNEAEALDRPVAGVDIPVAKAILQYNMRRYPDGQLTSFMRHVVLLTMTGVFFLYFQARLHTSQCEPELANSRCRDFLP
jgi:hypothetical protein